MNVIALHFSFLLWFLQQKNLVLFLEKFTQTRKKYRLSTDLRSDTSGYEVENMKVKDRNC